MTFTMIIRATIVGGQLHVAVEGKDKVVGTAAWFPPGSDFLSEFVPSISLSSCR